MCDLISRRLRGDLGTPANLRNRRSQRPLLAVTLPRRAWNAASVRTGGTEPVSATGLVLHSLHVQPGGYRCVPCREFDNIL